MITEPRLEHITPEIAQEYMSHNVRNRQPKPWEIESLAREIQRGEYITTHQGIAFNERGELVDGQQRLLSVIAANQPIDIFVTRGLPDAAMAVIDRGESRSIRDVMEMFGDPASPDAKLLRNGYALASITQLIRHGYRDTKVTANDVLRVFSKVQPMVHLCYRSVITNRKSMQRTRRGALTAAIIAAMLCGVSEEAIERFLEVYLRNDVTGCEGYNIAAPLALSEQILEAKARGASINGRRLYLATQNAIYHFVENTSTKQFHPITKPRYDVSAIIADALSNRRA